MATAVTLLALLVNPAAPALSLRMAAAAVVAFTFTTALAVHPRRP